jgi:hypothetical protein
MVGIASALGVPLILCLMFLWARYVEYFTLRRMLRNGTAQVLRRILSRYKGKTFGIMTEESLKGLVFAAYELGATRSQRYVFEKAVTAEIPSLAPYLIKLMNVCPHPRCTLKTYIFPQI